MLQDFIVDLATSEATLAGIGERPTTLVVDLMQVRLDVTGASKSGDGVRLIDVIAAISGQSGRWPLEAMKALEVKFDSGDAAWLRAYTHALSALCEFLLAHDFHASFDAVAPHFWARPETPFAAELAAPAPPNMFTDFESRPTTLADLLAAIHLLNWPVVAPERMRAARTHLLAMITDSRLSWKLINAETGDDREWIPNPRQKHAALGQLVSPEQMTAWFAFLDEGEAILEGRRLAPHWRFAKGVDVKAFFEKPQTFDLVLFVTGQGALPYLSNGPITSPERWAQIIRAFEGNSSSSQFGLIDGAGSSSLIPWPTLRGREAPGARGFEARVALRPPAPPDDSMKALLRRRGACLGGPRRGDGRAYSNRFVICRRLSHLAAAPATPRRSSRSV
jgi:hypothetical protein